MINNKLNNNSNNFDVIYKLYPPFFGVPEEPNIHDAWEVFCCHLLNLDNKTNKIIRRHAPDSGIDLLYQDKKIAYQCKFVKSGDSSKFNTNHVIKSIKSAKKARDIGKVDWETYILCTNVKISGPKEATLRRAFLGLIIHSETQWQNLCKKFSTEVSRYFKKLIPIDKKEGKEKPNYIFQSRSKRLPYGCLFTFTLTNMDNLAMKVSTKDRKLHLLLSGSPALKYVRSYPNYIEMQCETRKVEDKTVEELQRIPFLIHDCRLYNTGKMIIQGEIQSLFYGFENPFPRQASVDLTSVSYVIIDALLFSYKVYRHHNYVGIITAKFEMDLDEADTLDITFYLNNQYPYDCKLSQGREKITVLKRDRIDKNVNSALKIGSNLINKVSHYFSYFNSNLINNLLVKFVLLDIERYETGIPLSGKWFSDLNINIDYSLPLEGQIKIFQETGNYTNSEDLETILPLYMDNILESFRTNEHGYVEYINFVQISGFPSPICDLKYLKELRISGSEIKQIPPEIGNLENLESLTLLSNQLSDLPETISRLKKLRLLGLHNNNFTTIPQGLRGLEDLEFLDLDLNNIEQIPDWISNLKNLQTLFLSRNSIRKLPETFKNLQNINTLNLSHNKFREIPKVIFNLKNLEEINLRGIPIGDMIIKFDELLRLRTLDLENCEISFLPDEFGKNLKYLNTIYLSHNPLNRKRTREILNKLNFRDKNDLWFIR